MSALRKTNRKMKSRSEWRLTTQQDKLDVAALIVNGYHKGQIRDALGLTPVQLFRIECSLGYGAKRVPAQPGAVRSRWARERRMQELHGVLTQAEYAKLFDLSLLQVKALRAKLKKTGGAN